MKCRHCQALVTLPFVDLGASPPSNSYMTNEQLTLPERWYPLRVAVCEACWLVQTEDFAEREEFFSPEYGYFSSASSSWLAHCERYAHDMVTRFGLNAQHRVVEVAANDGYLLQYFKKAGVPCYGVEPTASTAQAARAKGIEIVEDFFGVALAQSLVAKGQSADLMAANNVLAHVPDINDFVGGFATLLTPNGVATFEFPHLLNLVQYAQFDTVYHEHYSYLSLTAVRTVFEANGLDVFDVQELPTHGGSLRVYAKNRGNTVHATTPAVAELLARETAAGVSTSAYYSKTQADALRVKRDLVRFLLDCQEKGKTVAAYGAAAKGNTLLNYAGVRPDLIKLVVDRSPGKQGKFMPGSRIPIVSEADLVALNPDFVVILPWNIQAEVREQLRANHPQAKWQYVTAIPRLEVSA
jgi:SAM-dependent methyltransferase